MCSVVATWESVDQQDDENRVCFVFRSQKLVRYLEGQNYLLAGIDELIAEAKKHCFDCQTYIEPRRRSEHIIGWMTKMQESDHGIIEETVSIEHLRYHKAALVLLALERMHRLATGVFPSTVKQAIERETEEITMLAEDRLLQGLRPIEIMFEIVKWKHLDAYIAGPRGGTNATNDLFDVAFSFASEQRDYVEAVAECLKKKGIRVFYDGYEQVSLWGKDLYGHLDEVYRRKARYCVIFASADYASRIWTTHELKSAQARAILERDEYILPVRFDATEIPGLRPTIGYVDASRFPPRQLCDLILAKLAVSTNASTPGDRTDTLAQPQRSQTSALNENSQSQEESLLSIEFRRNPSPLHSPTWVEIVNQRRDNRPLKLEAVRIVGIWPDREEPIRDYPGMLGNEPELVKDIESEDKRSFPFPLSEAAWFRLDKNLLGYCAEVELRDRRRFRSSIVYRPSQAPNATEAPQLPPS